MDEELRVELSVERVELPGDDDSESPHETSP
jgi:hypothetical protein